MTVHPEVDEVTCIVSGTCEALAPRLFRLDDDGVVQVLKVELDDDLLELAREAARACPSRALTLQES
jgi:ferredoxin